MRFLKQCWQNSPQTISLADGDANTGGFLQDMIQSMVSGCILGLYQEEEIFSECMGLDSEGMGGNAGLLNNICDGTSQSQKRKDGARNLLLRVPRLNFLGNGHPHPWHIRQEHASSSGFLFARLPLPLQLGPTGVWEKIFDCQSRMGRLRECTMSKGCPII
jgi:hypothetical protein